MTLRVIRVLIVLGAAASAQDDLTTRNGASSYGGGFITGPAANPLSFLNGPAFRTFGSSWPYLLRDTRPASIMNGHLPAWILFGVEERLRWERESASSFRQGSVDSYLLNRTRLQMELKPVAWMKLVAQAQDSRVSFHQSPVGPPNEAAWDLKLAYTEWGDPERSWISLRVGRQLINYNNTMLANSEWRNQGRSYDAAVANLHYGRFRAGIFAASVVIPTDQGFSHHRQGNNIYGAYGWIDRPLPNSSLEPFVLWRLQPSVAVETTGARVGKQDEKAFGIRYKGTARDHFEYSIEAVVERGRAGADMIQASAVTGGVAYRFSRTRWMPRAFWQFDWASGDKNPSDGIHGTFDAMYPTAHDRFGIADQFGWQNIRSNRAGVTIEPFRRWSVTAGYLDIHLASAKDGIYNSSGGVVIRDVTGRSGTHVAQEFDCYTWLELNRHLNVGGGLGYILPEGFLKANNRGASYAYPYFAINFKDLDRKSHQ